MGKCIELLLQLQSDGAGQIRYAMVIKD